MNEWIVLCLVTQSSLTLCDPMDCSSPGSSVYGILQVRILEWVAMPSSGDLPNPGIKPSSPALQVDSLPCEPPGKPKNTGVGSQSLLQGSSRPRNRTGVSCIAGGFFTSWATKEAQLKPYLVNSQLFSISSSKPRKGHNFKGMVSWGTVEFEDFFATEISRSQPDLKDEVYTTVCKNTADGNLKNLI